MNSPDKIIPTIENHPRLREVISKQLLVLRAWKNEIPPEIKTSVSPDNKYKVRKAWWQGLIGAFENAVSSGLIKEPSLSLKIQQFINYYTAPEQKIPRARVTKKDIDMADELLEEVLKNIN